MDEMYEKLLCDIFGSAFINDYKVKCSHQWLNMMVDFEKRKRAASPGSTSSTNLPLHFGFARQFEDYTKKKFESVFKETTTSGVTFTSSGMLCISSARMAKLFQKVLISIEGHLKNLLQQQAVSDVKYIFLVGGFGESSYLRELICKKFGAGRTILIPEEASMCVVKGAVLYGHNPDDIASRVSRFTYAVATNRKFITGTDAEEHKKVVEGVGERIGHLKPLVQVGEALPLHTIRSTTLHPLKPDQTQVGFALYISENILHETKVHPKDEGVLKMAQITVESPDTSKGKKRDIKVSITFGGTEIYFSAVDLASGNTAGTSINYN